MHHPHAVLIPSLLPPLTFPEFRMTFPADQAYPKVLEQSPLRLIPKRMMLSYCKRRMVLTLPTRTISTTSMVAASVTRKPFLKLGWIPSLVSH